MGQTAELDWKEGGVPVSRQFDDPYFSLENGLAETRHVFLAGNGLPARFGGDFSLAETGFGTGLNFLVTWAAWEEAGKPGRVTFTSFEAFPMAVADMRTALAAFPQVAPQATRLCDALQAEAELAFGGISLEIVAGDVRETLPRWPGRADAWYLDGFSPAKNPEMWGGNLMMQVAQHTAPGGTLATYTAAGHVRRSLTEAGFDVRRVPGFGRKRHMTTARMPA